MRLTRMRTSSILVFGFLLVFSILNSVLAQGKLNIYGFFSTRFEKVFNEPAIGENGQTVKEGAPAEWSTPFFSTMFQHYINEKFRVYIVLNGSGAGNLDVQNYWGEYSASPGFNVRVGKAYRKFGLYNEILDAVPTYYGIEPPELFDGDHLIVSRNTTAMIYGALNMGPTSTFNYSVSTDNGEGGPAKGLVPLGWDANIRFVGGDFIVGTSGYTSGGETTSDVSVGGGSPNSGVLPWMASDKFSIFGGYGEANIGNGLIQAAYWKASHDAVRDPASVLAVINGANPNAAQLARFLNDPNAALTTDNVNTEGDYDVTTWYLRAGLSLEAPAGEFAPYIQWDSYENPETIQNKTFGGDNEAGFADDGKFNKATIGLIFRPTPEVALKFDGSSHFQNFNGQSESYSEFRFDISFIFGP